MIQILHGNNENKTNWKQSMISGVQDDFDLQPRPYHFSPFWKMRNQLSISQSTSDIFDPEHHRSSSCPMSSHHSLTVATSFQSNFSGRAVDLMRKGLSWSLAWC